MVFLHHFQQYFSYIVAVSFIGGRNLRKPLKSTIEHMQEKTNYNGYIYLFLINVSYTL